MGQRGRKPTPTKILKLRGSRRVELRTNEPQPLAKKPSCPTWMDPESKRLFRKLVKELGAIDLLTTLDGDALTRYCRLTTRWRAAERFLQEYGTTYEIDKIGIKPYPQVRESNTLAAELLRLENHFGLTPSARASLQVTPSEGKDASKTKERFFRNQA